MAWCESSDSLLPEWIMTQFTDAGTHHQTPVFYLISPSIEWPPFPRRYFQMHFRESKVLYFGWNVTEVCFEKIFYLMIVFFSQSLVAFLLRKTEDNCIIEGSHFGTNIKTEYDTNGIINNTAIRRLVLINNNRGKCHPILSTIFPHF